METKLEELKKAADELGQSIENLKQLFIRLIKAFNVHNKLVYDCPNCGAVCDRNCDNCDFCSTSVETEKVPF